MKQKGTSRGGRREGKEGGRRNEEGGKRGSVRILILTSNSQPIASVLLMTDKVGVVGEEDLPLLCGLSSWTLNLIGRRQALDPLAILTFLGSCSGAPPSSNEPVSRWLGLKSSFLWPLSSPEAPEWRQVCGFTWWLW